MTAFKLDRGESCSDYSSDREDWDTSVFFINPDCVTLEERRHKLPNGYSTSFYVFGPGVDVQVTEAAFKRLRAAMESM